jgi:cytochrome c oxidase subunit 3
MKNYQLHPYHIVDPSPWPLVTSVFAFTMLLGSVLYFNGYLGGLFCSFFGFFFLLLSLFAWWQDVIRESTFEGHHTSLVQIGLRLGMILFIVSEVMFFFGFFWAFFHSALAPTPEIGGVFPPKGIAVFSAWEVPLLNTLILLTSGASVTWSHNAILLGDRFQAILSLVITILLAILFTCFQVFEYCSASFTISDSVYGSTFYLATGFHGFHILMGTTFLLVCLVRLLKHHFTVQHHFGFEAAAWYYHFVDVVWLFLFAVIYWWGGF